MNSISKEKFLAFETVRDSGRTNMFDVNNVRKIAKMLTGVILTKEDCVDIFRYYSVYKDKFLTKAK